MVCTGSVPPLGEKRTYRADGYDTFEEYCRERWGWNDSRARQLMRSAEVMAELGSGNVLPLPANARQADELSRAPAGQREEIWQNVVEEHGERVTAADVREAVRLFVPRG